MLPQFHKWSSHYSFLFVAVGAAAGLGNVWRFPYLAFEHGGFSFFLAYAICLLLIGAPFLYMEFLAGKNEELSPPRTLAHVTNWQWTRFLGWSGVLLGGVVATYYSVITSWILSYLNNAIGMNWGNDAAGFFTDTVLQQSLDVSIKGDLIFPLLFGTAVVWFLCFLLVWRGIGSMAFFLSFITPFSIVLLFAITIISMFLPGAFSGLKLFFLPHFEHFLHLKIWIDAAIQVFFSLMLGFGIMMTYGAHLDKHHNPLLLTKYIIFFDTLVAFLSGVLIFSLLGNLSLTENVPVAELVKGGLGITFVVLPNAFSHLSFLGSFLSFLFFLFLFFLALASLASFVKNVVTTLAEKLSPTPYSIVAFVVCGFLFFASQVFLFSNGIFLIDIVDHFVFGYAILLISALQAFVIGFHGFSRISPQIPFFLRPLLKIWFTFVLPTVLLVLWFFKIHNDFSPQPEKTSWIYYNGYPIETLCMYGLFLLLFVFLLSLFFTIRFSKLPVKISKNA